MTILSRLGVAVAATALALGAFSSCSNDPTLNNGGVVTFHQIDEEGRPGVETIFVPFVDHDANDRAAPGADAPTLVSQITTFMTGATTANRSAAIAASAASIFAPNVLIANLNVTPPAGTHGYLGIETNGVTGNLFGGRYLNDDVMTTDLSIAFGSTLTTVAPNSYPFNAPPSSTTPPPDDGHEYDGGASGPQLTTDYVTPGPASSPAATFPYLSPAQ